MYLFINLKRPKINFYVVYIMYMSVWEGYNDAQYTATTTKWGLSTVVYP